MMEEERRYRRRRALRNEIKVLDQQIAVAIKLINALSERSRLSVSPNLPKIPSNPHWLDSALMNDRINYCPSKRSKTDCKCHGCLPTDFKMPDYPYSKDLLREKEEGCFCMHHEPHLLQLATDEGCRNDFIKMIRRSGSICYDDTWQEWKQWWGEHEYMYYGPKPYPALGVMVPLGYEYICMQQYHHLYCCAHCRGIMTIETALKCRWQCRHHGHYVCKTCEETNENDHEVLKSKYSCPFCPVQEFIREDISEFE